MVEPTGHCPYLGLKQNQAIRFASPTAEHRCYVTGQAQDIPVPQAEYCLSSGHINCPLYIGLTASTMPVPRARAEEAPAPPRGLAGWMGGLSRRDRLIYTFLISLLGIIFIIYAVAGINIFFPTNAANEPTSIPPLSTTANSTPSHTIAPATATPTPTTTPTASRTPTNTATPSNTPTATIAIPTGIIVTQPPTIFVPTLPPPPPTTELPTNTETPPTPTDTVAPYPPPATATSEPPTEAPPTEAPPTDVPPTEAPPTDVPPTEEPPTAEPPTAEPPTIEQTPQRTPAPGTPAP
jgi:hypothetical protein